jgi:DNA-binding XRE family transcriptional regulator
MVDNPMKQAIEIICVNLPSLRGMLNITQQKLAEQIGTSRQGIINFEHQEKKLTRSMLIAIVTYFSLRGRSAAFLKSLGLYKNSYINSLGFDEQLCDYIIENNTLEN